jgi:glycosidase
MTANVEVEDADGASLLNHYRRLIHLRSENAALGYGDFVPLSTGSSAVVAYLRRKNSRTVLVIANLGPRPISGVSLSSTGNVLKPGEYRAKSLLGKSIETRLQVSGRGSIDKWIPVGTIEPHEAHIIDVSRRD